VDGRTHNGEILISGYALKVTGEESKTASGKIGSGAARITLSTDVGDVTIKQGRGIHGRTCKPLPPLPRLRPS